MTPMPTYDDAIANTLAPIDPSLRTRPVDGSGRRVFLRAAIAAGLMLHGLPGHAQAATGVIFAFPLRQSLQNLVAAILREMRPRYRPDLGERPVYVPGNGGASAMAAVANASADGSALLLASSSSMTLFPIMNKPPVDATRDLQAVAGIGDLCYTFIIGPLVPNDVRTVADYLRWAQRNPGEARYGIPGRGTSAHFVGLEVARLADVPLRSVGYQGVQPILQDVANGSMPAAVTLSPSASDLVAFPNIRVLGVSSGKRWPAFPDVPTLLELGLAETGTVDSVGFFVTNRLPAQGLTDLREALALALGAPATIAAVEAAGLRPIPPDVDYAAQIAREHAEWQSRVDRHHFSMTS